MSSIDALPPLREVIARHRLAARKSLGQNFLLDLNLTAKIARAAGDLTGADVLEIGPGPGGLTRGLLAEGARRVVAVEKDRRCIPALEEISQAYPGRLEIVNEDALALDVAARLTPPVRIVANLPYNVGTELLTLAGPARLAALLDQFDADVSARSGRADRRPARQQKLWAVVDPGGVAFGRKDRDGSAARGVHATAEGAIRGGAFEGALQAAVSGGCRGADGCGRAGIQPAAKDAPVIAEGAGARHRESAVGGGYRAHGPRRNRRT